ncbi:MAG: exopolysaccharide biosynthesis polyprenyl glycosylphosphotransferase [Oscillospiraceae bacterium]
MAVKKYVKKIERSTIFVIKLVLFMSLFLLFFGLFAIDNPQIIGQNRTAAITMTTFVILGISMTAVYGGFAVGKKKSKEIIPPLSIAVFITDFVTYFQLCIMNVNRYNEATLTFQNVGIFFLVFLLQIVVISLFVYFGNYVYFKLNPPENCIIICTEISKASEILPKIGRYKKQYKITDIITYKNEDMKKLIRNSDSVFIYDVPAEFRSDMIDYAYKHFTNIYLTTELSDVVINYAKPIVIDDLSMLSSNIKELSFEQKFIKRTLDIVISGLAIIIFSPIMLIEAICIKAYDKGPVFFKQQRATLHEKLFDVLKFRTMVVDADKIEGYHPATNKDDRITPIGKVLRKLRIDELPQLFNILVGDMSIVGPRPERIEHVEMYTHDLPEFKYRLRAKAGLTGLAQIAGKYNTSPKDKLILDLMYIEKYSVWMDIMLMFQTVGVFFKSDSTEGFSDEKMVDFVKHQTKKDNVKK